MKQGPSKDVAMFRFCCWSTAKHAACPYQQLTTNLLALAIPACRAVRIHSRCKQPGLWQRIPAVLSLTQREYPKVTKPVSHASPKQQVEQNIYKLETKDSFQEINVKSTQQPLWVLPAHWFPVICLEFSFFFPYCGDMLTFISLEQVPNGRFQLGIGSACVQVT